MTTRTFRRDEDTFFSLLEVTPYATQVTDSRGVPVDVIDTRDVADLVDEAKRAGFVEV